MQQINSNSVARMSMLLEHSRARKGQKQARKKHARNAIATQATQRHHENPVASSVLTHSTRASYHAAVSAILVRKQPAQQQHSSAQQKQSRLTRLNRLTCPAGMASKAAMAPALHGRRRPARMTHSLILFVLQQWPSSPASRARSFVPPTGATRPRQSNPSTSWPTNSSMALPSLCRPTRGRSSWWSTWPPNEA